MYTTSSPALPRIFAIRSVPMSPDPTIAAVTFFPAMPELSYRPARRPRRAFR